MATQLSEDRVARQVGLAPETRMTFEVEGGKTVYTNSLVGIRADDGKVEPVNSSNFGTPGYSAIGLTEEHSEPDPTDEVEVGDNGKREIEVVFGTAIELDAENALNGVQDIGSAAYATSDHEFALSDDSGSRPQIGVVRELLAGATDRAVVEIADLPDQG